MTLINFDVELVLTWAANCVIIYTDVTNQNPIINNNLKTYENIRKIAPGRGDDYTAGCLLDYIYFKSYYKMIVVDFSKQQTLDADCKAIE